MGLINDFPLLGPFNGLQQKNPDDFGSAIFGNDWRVHALQENAKASSFIFFHYNEAQSLLWSIAPKCKSTANPNDISLKCNCILHPNDISWFQSLDDTGRVANSNCMLTQLATHPKELLATYLKDMCRVFRTLHVGRHWTWVSMDRNVRRRNASAMCWVTFIPI